MEPENVEILAKIIAMSDIEKQQLIGMLIRKASYLREALTKIKNLHYVQAHQAKKIAIDALAKEAL